LKIGDPLPEIATLFLIESERVDAFTSACINNGIQEREVKDLYYYWQFRHDLGTPIRNQSDLKLVPILQEVVTKKLRKINEFGCNSDLEEL